MRPSGRAGRRPRLVTGLGQAPLVRAVLSITPLPGLRETGKVPGVAPDRGRSGRCGWGAGGSILVGRWVRLAG